LIVYLLLFILVFASWPGLFQYKQAYLAGSIYIIANAIFPVWLLQGFENMRAVTVAIFFSRLFYLVCLIYWVSDADDVVSAIIVNGVTHLLISIIVVLFSLRKYRVSLTKLTFSDLILTLRSGFDIFISNISISLYSQAVVIYISFFTGTQAAGVFAAAEKVIQAVKGLVQPFSQSLFPYLGYEFSVNRENSMKLVIKYFIFIFLSFSGVCFLLFWLSPLIAEFFVGKEDPLVVDLLQIMSIIPLLVALSNLFGVQLLVNLGYELIFRRIIILNSLFGLFVLVVLVREHGSYGAAVGTLLTELLVTLSMAYFTFRLRVCKSTA